MTYHISLGSDCSVAYQLDKHQLRSHAFPFDWLLTPNIMGIINCIDDDFKKLFVDLEHKNISDNFAYIDDTNTFIPNDASTNKMIRIVNKNYKMSFVHDFQFDMSNYDIVVEKYQRRINRFYEVMKDETINKIFYRIGPKKEESLIKKLMDCFNDKHFKNYNIKFCSFSDIGSSNDWKRNNFRWDLFFDT